MAAEAGKDNRENGSTTLDASEFQELIRGGRTSADAESVDADKAAAYLSEDSDKEPEVAVVDEPKRRVSVIDPLSDTRTSAVVPATEKTADPNLTRALETIDRQAQLLVDRSVVASTEREPVVEMIDVFPGVRLPKDKSRWPIQLTPDMVRSVGLDPGQNGEVAAALNTLGNAFFILLNNAVSQSAVGAMEVQRIARENSDAARRAFESAYPDLRGQEDLTGAIEMSMRREGFHERKLSAAQYAAELATRTRMRVAALRGQTMDDYMRTAVPNSASATETRSTRSRATLSPGSSSRSREANRSQSDRELDDMMIK